MSPDAVVAFLVIGLPVLLIWVWALVDAVRNDELSAGARAAWLVAIVLLPAVGALAYVAVPGRRRLRLNG